MKEELDALNEALTKACKEVVDAWTANALRRYLLPVGTPPMSEQEYKKMLQQTEETRRLTDEQEHA